VLHFLPNQELSSSKYRRCSGILQNLLLAIFKKTNFDFGQFEENQSLCVNLNFTGEVMCQVEKNRQIDVSSCTKKLKVVVALYFRFICIIVCHFKKILFKMAMQAQNSPELECLQQEVLELAAAKMNLTLEFACFSQLDTSVLL